MLTLFNCCCSRRRGDSIASDAAELMVVEESSTSHSDSASTASTSPPATPGFAPSLSAIHTPDQTQTQTQTRTRFHTPIATESESRVKTRTQETTRLEPAVTPRLQRPSVIALATSIGGADSVRTVSRATTRASSLKGAYTPINFGDADVVQSSGLRAFCEQAFNEYGQTRVTIDWQFRIEPSLQASAQAILERTKAVAGSASHLEKFVARERPLLARLRLDETDSACLSTLDLAEIQLVKLDVAARVARVKPASLREEFVKELVKGQDDMNWLFLMNIFFQLFNRMAYIGNSSGRESSNDEKSDTKLEYVLSESQMKLPTMAAPFPKGEAAAGLLATLNGVYGRFIRGRSVITVDLHSRRVAAAKLAQALAERFQLVMPEAITLVGY